MEISSQGSREIRTRQHVVILHEKLVKRKHDRYILNLALAYHELGYKVTILTSQFEKGECFEDFQFTDKVDIQFSAWWIPRSILGLFKSNMCALKAAWMACRLIFCRQDRKPDLIVLDISLVALYLLHLFTKYKIFYVANFEKPTNPDTCYEHSRYFPSLLEAKWIKLADEIIVQSAAFGEIFKKSFPAVTKSPMVLYPSVDLGLWNEPGINIQRIIPDLLDNTIFILSIGKYRKSSNFQLAMDAFEMLLQLMNDKATTQTFQLVIAGNCKTADEKHHYEELKSLAKEKLCASQITFLIQLPLIHEKTLIAESHIMIHPAKNDVHSDFLLKAMSLGKPIVATNKGIASKILVNKVSGITTESEVTAIAQVLQKLMTNPHLQAFMGDIARDAFQKNYSFASMCQKLCLIMKKSITQKRTIQSEINDIVK